MLRVLGLFEFCKYQQQYIVAFRPKGLQCMSLGFGAGRVQGATIQGFDEVEYGVFYSLGIRLLQSGFI